MNLFNLLLIFASLIPQQTTCRELHTEATRHPERLKDKLLLLPTEGMEPTDGKQLMFRKRTDQPPLVVCRFARQLPDSLPKAIIGKCTSVDNGTVIVTALNPTTAPEHK